jgi:hypothetical protein
MERARTHTGAVAGGWLASPRRRARAAPPRTEPAERGAINGGAISGTEIGAVGQGTHLGERGAAGMAGGARPRLI